MLTAAICGDIFTSPPVNSILAVRHHQFLYISPVLFLFLASRLNLEIDLNFVPFLQAIRAVTGTMGCLLIVKVLNFPLADIELLIVSLKYA